MECCDLKPRYVVIGTEAEKWSALYWAEAEDCFVL